MTPRHFIREDKCNFSGNSVSLDHWTSCPEPHRETVVGTGTRIHAQETAFSKNLVDSSPFIYTGGITTSDMASSATVTIYVPPYTPPGHFKNEFRPHKGWLSMTHFSSAFGSEQWYADWDEAETDFRVHDYYVKKAFDAQLKPVLEQARSVLEHAPLCTMRVYIGHGHSHENEGGVSMAELLKLHIRTWADYNNVRIGFRRDAPSFGISEPDGLFGFTSARIIDTTTNGQTPEESWQTLEVRDGFFDASAEYNTVPMELTLNRDVPLEWRNSIKVQTDACLDGWDCGCVERTWCVWPYNCFNTVPASRPFDMHLMLDLDLDLEDRETQHEQLRAQFLKDVALKTVNMHVMENAVYGNSSKPLWLVTSREDMKEGFRRALRAATRGYDVDWALLWSDKGFVAARLME
jgi:hypothetical protein